MGEKSKRRVPDWMQTLADKYDIDPETVLGISSTFRGYHIRKRTESFFELYFEGRNKQ